MAEHHRLDAVRAHLLELAGDTTAAYAPTARPPVSPPACRNAVTSSPAPSVCAARGGPSPGPGHPRGPSSDPSRPWRRLCACSGPIPVLRPAGLLAHRPSRPTGMDERPAEVRRRGRGTPASVSQLIRSTPVMRLIVEPHQAGQRRAFRPRRSSPAHGRGRTACTRRMLAPAFPGSVGGRRAARGAEVRSGRRHGRRWPSGETCWSPRSSGTPTASKTPMPPAGHGSSHSRMDPVDLVHRITCPRQRLRPRPLIASTTGEPLTAQRKHR